MEEVFTTAGSGGELESGTTFMDCDAVAVTKDEEEEAEEERITEAFEDSEGREVRRTGPSGARPPPVAEEA